MLQTLQNYFLVNYEWNKVGESQYCSISKYRKDYPGITFEQCQSHCEETVECKHIDWNAIVDYSECTLLDCKEWDTDSFQPTQETWEINRNKKTTGLCF